MRLIATGDWPNQITLRQGWGKARSRPWNDDTPAASLRLDRGNSGFITNCVDYLRGLGVEDVMSPPLIGNATKVWERAEFVPHLRLHLYRRNLITAAEPAAKAVKVVRHPDWRRLAEIDRTAFDATWRMEELGLREAFDATPRACVLVSTVDTTTIAGFAIVGVGGTSAYLQRIAVDANLTGSGWGRSLVRSALSWATGRGATSMLLNTQPENVRAQTLYESEGFERLRSPLHVFRNNG